MTTLTAVGPRPPRAWSSVASPRVAGPTLLGAVGISPLRRNRFPDGTVRRRRSRCGSRSGLPQSGRLGLREVLVHLADDDRALTHGRCHTLDGSGAHVA